MQSTTYIKQSAPSSQRHTINTKGKSPNLCQIVAFVNEVDRKHHSIILSQTTILEHPPLLSPHTRVCGKRWTYNKTKEPLDMKIHVHKERNNYANTTYRLNTKTQGHNHNTKNSDKDLSKQPNTYIKKPIKHISKNKHSSQYSNPPTQIMSTQYVLSSTLPNKQKARKKNTWNI